MSSMNFVNREFMTQVRVLTIVVSEEPVRLVLSAARVHFAFLVNSVLRIVLLRQFEGCNSWPRTVQHGAFPKQVPTPCSVSNVASKATVGLDLSIARIAAP